MEEKLKRKVDFVIEHGFFLFHYFAMGTCLGIIFALVVFVSTALTLVFQWNVSSTVKFERADHAEETQKTTEQGR